MSGKVHHEQMDKDDEDSQPGNVETGVPFKGNSSLENEEATVKKTCANLGSASQVKNSDCDCEGLCIYPLSNRSLTLKLLLKSNAPIGFPWRICVLCLLARAYLPSLVVV